MKRFIAFVFAATLLNAAPIKIGVIGPFSGIQAWWGTPYKNSVLLAYEELGLTPDRVKLIFEDTHYEFPQVAMCANKLLQVDHVDAIIDTFDKSSYIVAPRTQKAKIPYLVMALDDRACDKKYSYAIWTPVQKTVNLFLEKAHAEGIKTIRLLVLKDYYPYRTEIELDKQIKAGYPDIKIVYRDYFNPDLIDFRTFSLKARQIPADLTVVLAYPPAETILVRQLLSDGVKKLSSVEGFDMLSDDISMLPEGTWWTGATQQSPAFEAAYKKRWGESTYTGPTFGYDCLKLLVAGFEKNREHPEDAMRGLSVEGFGGTTTITQDGEIDMPAYLRVRQNGQSIVLKSE